MTTAGTRVFPQTEIILAAVAEGGCPSCGQRLDPDLVDTTGRCGYWLDHYATVVAAGGCVDCNSRWEVTTEQWGHWPLRVELAGSKYGACTCFGGRVGHAPGV